MVTYFYWWYQEELIYLFNAVINTCKRIFYTFSIPLLLRTLFYPWKNDALYKENPSLSDAFQILIGNLVSRFVGATVRLMTIFAGLIVTCLIFICGIILLISWIFLPIIIIYLSVSGVRNLNG